MAQLLECWLDRIRFRESGKWVDTIPFVTTLVFREHVAYLVLMRKVWSDREQVIGSCLRGGTMNREGGERGWLDGNQHNPSLGA